VRLRIVNRQAGFSAIASLTAARDRDAAADRQRLVAVALEPSLDVAIEAGEQ
jgi:hypothetical protein